MIFYAVYPMNFIAEPNHMNIFNIHVRNMLNGINRYVHTQGKCYVINVSVYFLVE